VYLEIRARLPSQIFVAEETCKCERRQALAPTSETISHYRRFENRVKRHGYRPAIGHISTYLPRECGIGLYTRDLMKSIGSGRFTHLVVAVDDGRPRLQYLSPVRFVIDADEPSDYVDAAEFLNKSKTSVVSLQHEYGIFGGDWGKHVLGLVSSLTKPLVTTFHTVLAEPPQLAREILREIASASKCVVVTLNRAERIIVDEYDVPARKVRVIRHGAPLATRKDYSVEKERLRLSGRRVISTVGFLSAAKGIQYGIRAVKSLIKQYPDIIYAVVGETHPLLKKHEGEAYRRKLKALIDAFDLGKHVMFVNRFVSEEELTMFLNIADVYVAPYQGRDQVSSGTLTRAMASGKAIVATPTLFARETLTPGRGLICKFGDAGSVARQVQRILSNPSLKRGLEVRAGQYGRKVGWRRVAQAYAKMFKKAIGS